MLAGGASRRFGSDKALATVGGEPLLVRTVRILREAGLDPVVLTRTPRGLGLPERIEADGPRHPLWGIAEVIGEGEAYFAPVDLVDLDVDRVRRLLAARAVARGQPLLGVWPRLDPAELRALATAGAPVRAVVAKLTLVDVGLFRNANVPIDLEL